MAKRARGMALGPKAQRTRPTVGLMQLERRRTTTGDPPHDLDERARSELSTGRRLDPNPNAARGRRHRPRIRQRPRGVACTLGSHGRCARGIGRRRVVRTAARSCQRGDGDERRDTSIRHDCHSRLRRRRCHCDRPPDCCEGHHIVHWSRGGPSPRRVATRRSAGAAEVVFQADDVVFAEVVAVLHLDEDEIIEAGVLDAV